MLKRLSQNKPFTVAIVILALALAFFALCFLVATIYPIDDRMQTPGKWVFGVDWKEFIGPDVRLLISGGNPYAQNFNEPIGLYPPWAYLLLSPLTLFTPGIGSVLIFSITYFAFAIILWKLGYRKSVIAIFLLSPFLYKCAWSGNIDWLAALGFIMPAPIGLIFVLIKPQIGIGIAILWIIQAWQRGKFREVIKTFAPVTVLYLLSFLIFGLWPLRMAQMPQYNLSYYPITLALGIILLWRGIKENKVQYAIASSPLLAPYANIYSYSITLFAFESPLPLGILVLLTWINH